MVFASLVIDLLAAGATLIAKGVFGEISKSAGKDAYDKLRAQLQKKHNVKTLDLIERVEETPALKATIEADIENSDAGADAETLRLVEALRVALAELPPETKAAYAIEGGRFEAGKDIIARQVEGLRNVEMKADGSIDLSGAKSPGK